MANPLPFQPIQEVPGAFVLDAPRFFDDRGFFQEYFHDGKYAEYLPKCKQTSICKLSLQPFSNPSAVSQKNVIRGMHCSPYGKLVQCLKGKIIDTIIDLREDSPTYLQKFSGNPAVVFLDLPVQLNSQEESKSFVLLGVVMDSLLVKMNPWFCMDKRVISMLKGKCM